MATKTQLIGQLRFGLEQLSVRNAQHEFEHLCREYARKRICSNLLPATGPVSAGGDQGRDFETFRSYLTETADLDVAFGGRVSEGPLAFACTLQKERLPTKIKTDVKAILASGFQVAGITYFCVADLPVAKRHELRAWSIEQGAELDVHDGAAMSENLAEPDCFWIASEYLAIPSEVFPTPVELEQEEYVELKERWARDGDTLITHSDFEEVKGMVRACSGDTPGQQDLPFWMERMRLFISDKSSRETKQRARYEVAVAQLRGLGSLNGHESIVVDFFNDIQPINTLSQLEDAVILLNYCMTANMIGQAEFMHGALAEWQQSLVDYVDQEIDQSDFASTQASMFQYRATLSMHTVEDAGISVDIASQMPWWLELTRVLDEAIMFPVERFADCLTIACPILGDQPDFDVVTAKVDAALSGRQGGFAAAEKCCDRAIAHYKQGRLQKAIAEIQKARINWFAKETLGASLKVLLLLSDWYLEMGLALAAKYHGLAAAYIAMHQSEFDVKQEAWKGLTRAANSDYSLGSFAGFLDLAQAASALHLQTANDAGNVSEHPDLQQLLMHTALAVGCSERLAPDCLSFLSERSRQIGMGELLDDALAAVREKFQNVDDAKLQATFEEQLNGVPISDLGYQRVVAWRALGVEWVVEWDNLYHRTVLAEQYVAGLQIVQSALGDQALCLPETRVHVVFDLGDVAVTTRSPLDSKDGFKWKVTWPSNADVSQLDGVLSRSVYACVDLLAGPSFLGENQAMKMLDSLMDSGLPAKAIIGQPYEVVYRDVIDEESFNAARAVVVVAGEAPRIPITRQHDELRGFVGSGPGYTREKAEELIRNRYERIPEHIPFTIASLNEAPEFLEMVKVLRSREWIDWHILSAIFTAVLNYRFAEKHGERGTPELMRKHIAKFMTVPESEDDPKVPVEVFTYENLDFHRRGNLGTILTAWSFQIHHPAYSDAIIQQFLADHYGYWTDDVPHDSIFSDSTIEPS